MRAIPAAVLLILVAVAPAATAQSSTYVHVVAQPAFQYQSDQDVQVPMQAELVRGNAPQQDSIRIEVWDHDKTQQFPVLNADDLAAGVRSYPAINYLHFGQLDAKLYSLRLVARAGGITREVFLDFSVVLPPIGYTAHLTGTGGKDAKFVFQPDNPDPARVFTIHVYRDGGDGIVRLADYRVTNATEVPVPYIPGEATKVSVDDPNHWVNYPHRQSSGSTTIYPPWIWEPDYTMIQNYQDNSLSQAIAAGFLILVFLAVVALLIWLGVFRRRQILPEQEAVR